MRCASPWIVLVLVAACGSEPTRPSPRAPAPPSTPEAPAETPTEREVPAVVDTDAFTPSRAPDLVTADAVFWADLEGGIIARAPREAGNGALGPARIVARDRRSPDHLVREADGDLYWVDYLREDARCDFVRLPATPGATPEVLFSDRLGDFSEMGCETDLAVDDARLYWLHGDEIRAASHAPTTAPAIETLARNERFPREIVVDATYVYWITLGADPYEDDLTRRGALRALPLSGGRARTLASRLTEPSGLTLEGAEITFVEQTEDGEQRRTHPRLE